MTSYEYEPDPDDGDWLALPPQPENVIAMETDLRKRFPAIVAGLQLTDILQLMPDRSLPRNLHMYRLTAIVPDLSDSYSPVEDLRSLSAGSYKNDIDPSVETNYKSEGRPPYLDTSYAIGLVFRNQLSALAAGGITNDGNVLIPQIQAVSGYTGGERFNSGLYGGFNWRHSLIEAWRVTAQEIGATNLEIQGTRNNAWMRRVTGKEPKAVQEDIIAERQRFYMAYDGIAQQLGFTLDETSGDWTKPVLENPAV